MFLLWNENPFGKADTIIADQQGCRIAFIRRELDGDPAFAPIRESVLQRVRNQFVDDKTAGNCGVDPECPLSDLNVQGYLVRLQAVYLHQRRQERPQEHFEIDAREILRLVECLMHGSHRADSILGGLQHRNRGCVLDTRGFHSQKAQDQLKVVLHTVMNLAEKDILLLNAAGQFRVDECGLSEITAAILIIAGYLKPKAGIAGGLIASLMFFITSSMVITTPGSTTTVHGIRYLSFIGLFLFKDVISLGVSLYLISYFGRESDRPRE